MDRVGVMTGGRILDTSWLLEFYRVPKHSRKARHENAVDQAKDASSGKMFVTLPVLFEFANHLVRVEHGGRRRQLIGRYRDHVADSLRIETPWTIVGEPDGGALLRAGTLIELADRFVAHSGEGYSLADISVIDLATRLREQRRVVKILTFDRELAAYAD